MPRRPERRYWRSLKERDSREEFLREASAEFEPPGGLVLNRRRFLSLSAVGFGFGVLAGGCGSGPVRKALSHVLAPEGTTPGRTLSYASTCLACPAGCGLLVRSRDGRPIKLEGNPGHALSRGGLCAVGQASLLGLYDRERLALPLRAGQPSSWSEVDQDIARRLGEIRQGGGAVRILTRTLTSPSTRFQIERFLGQFPDGRCVTYDPLSSSAIPDAHLQTHGTRRLPHYRLERAEVVVSFDADFLGTWISPVEHTRAYAAGRLLEGAPPRGSWHAQFESRLSVTGAKADLRIPVAPGELGVLLTHLAERLADRSGAAWWAGGLEAPPVAASVLDEVAGRLWGARGRSLVLCGSQDLESQVLCNFLNHLLGNYGSTLDLERPSLQRQGNDAELAGLLGELDAGRVAALFVLEGNPAYELPVGKAWAGWIRRVPLSVSCSERLDETARTMTHVCPRPHALACWGDAEPVVGTYSLAQPAFPVLGEARPVLESLAAWSGGPGTALELIQEHWRTRLHPRQSAQPVFQLFWDRAVHDGVATLPVALPEAPGFSLQAVRPVPRARPEGSGDFELVLYPKVALLDGSHAYNPWLQELPDPVTKVAWDNYVCVAPGSARRLGVGDGDVVRVRAGEDAIELPVLVQPGQHERTLAVALGYGSRLSERFASIGPRWLQAGPTLGEHGQVGRNAAPLLSLEGGRLRYVRLSCGITSLGRKQPLALSQTHHAITVPAGLAPAGQERRPMVQETTLAECREPAAPGGHAGPGKGLWPEDHRSPGPRWGMVIDLNRCTGCSACVISCQVENNIPVVGKDEVRRQRDLHWIRIDRYYADAPDGSGGVDVAFQPMMCHHCGDAPCETVCPVLATVQSSEGLNQQVYNRCVGTRYCANNCPYKVRRFNWFDYPRPDALQNLALNPDVTVRSRGVMEKCSLCVQRIQEAKMEARRLGVPLADGAAQTACQQSCPAGAIVFGDLRDLESAAARRAGQARSYQVLAELNVKPAVHYQRIVRNRPRPEGGHHV